MKPVDIERREYAEDEIAIVGMACRVPGARNLSDYWRLLVEGREGLRIFSREELLRAGHAPSTVDDPAYVPVKGLIESADCFDARFFGISPRDATLMDPQHRVFLESAWHALEHAGYCPDAVPGDVGVFAGCGQPSYLYENLRTDKPLLETDDGYSKFIGNDKDFLATRVAWHLGLEGPALDIQTACSTSLVAVVSACTALLTWQCDTALAGGVAISTPLVGGYVYREGAIFSPDGRCRPFDADARGTVLGTGVGVVVLKRLHDAIESGDTIHGIIRGFGLNNDGRHKAGFTAPSARGQARAIAMAHSLAHVEPHEVGYVEAHGTGTRLGDPVEVTALNQVFGKGAVRPGSCVLGAVKGNIGHLDAAAGVVGLIKATLAARYGLLPGTMHFARPNPEIPFGDGPFVVRAESSPWSPARPRIAGVSAFGVGGTNAHVVLEGVPPLESSPSMRGRTHLWVTSGPSSEAARRCGDALESWASEGRGFVEPDLVARTLMNGRKVFRHRTFRLATSSGDGTVQIGGPGVRPVEAGRDPHVLFIFPGQGTQRVGMGRDIFDCEASFRQVLVRLAAVYAEETGDDLLDLLYPPAGAAGSGERPLDATRIAQPALFAVELAWAEALRSRGVEPDALIGHSLGEWAAATVAGVFAPRDAMRLVIHRGRLMQSMEPGAMLSVAAPATIVEQVGGGVELAAENGPELCVLSGSFDAIASVEAQLARLGIAAKRLRTSHAFHSASMEPMLEEFARRVAQYPRRAPRIPVISNVGGDWLSAEQATSPDYWARQVRGTVRFASGLRRAASSRDTVCIEVGPGRAMSRLAASAFGRERSVAVVSKQAGEARSTWLACLGSAWSHGLPVRMPAARVPAPLYPFERVRHWVERPDVTISGSRDGSDVPLKEGEPGDWLYTCEWTPVSASSRSRQAFVSAPWLVICDEPSVCRQLVAALASRGVEATGLTLGEPVENTSGLCVPWDDPAAWAAALASLSGDGFVARTVIYHSTRQGRAGRPVWSPAFTLAGLTAALEARAAVPMLLVTLADCMFAVAPDDRPDPAAAALHCAGRAVQWVCPWIEGISLDCGAGPNDLADRLLVEVPSAVRFGQVAIRDGVRHEARFVKLGPSSPRDLEIDAEAVYLITGGLGGIGLTLAERLVSRGARQVWLTSRRGLLDDGQGHDTAIVDQLRRLDSLGAQVEVRAVDVVDAAAMRGLVDEIRATGRRLAGVVHAAGIFRETPLNGLQASDFEALFAPKVDGTRNLLAALADTSTDFVLVCSSASVSLSLQGSVGYSAANAAMEATAGDLRSDVIRLQWDDWGQVGMAQGSLRSSRVREQALLTPAEGADVFEHCMRIAQSWLLNCTRAPERLLNHAREQLSSVVGPMASSPATGPCAAVRMVLADALGIPDLGDDDDFFELGGHSLLAVRVAADISRATGVRISSHALLSHSTAAALSQHVSTLKAEDAPAAAAGSGEPLVVPLNASDSADVLFLIHPVGGTVFQYRALAKRLSGRYRVVGIRSPGLEDGEHIDGDFGSLARRYARVVRSEQPRGPYHLGGHSLGGAMAHEMAHVLAAEGESIGGIIMLDTPSPGEVPDTLRDQISISDYLRLLAPEWWASLSDAAPERQDIESVELGRFFDLFRFHAEAMNAHRARESTPGEILFVRARSRDDFNVDRPESGWLDRASDGLAFRVVDGNHINMIFEPFVARVAEVIVEWARS